MHFFSSYSKIQEGNKMRIQNVLLLYLYNIHSTIYRDTVHLSSTPRSFLPLGGFNSIVVSQLDHAKDTWFDSCRPSVALCNK